MFDFLKSAEGVLISFMALAVLGGLFWIHEYNTTERLAVEHGYIKRAVCKDYEAEWFEPGLNLMDALKNDPRLKDSPSAQ